MMERLILANCKTNDEVCKLISERVDSVSFSDLMIEVEKKFIYQHAATKAIYTGLSDNLNVFLSGPGGYGKSKLIKFILDFYGIPYVVISGYKDMPVDALLGIPNMSKLLNESKYEINFSDSAFCRPGILIGEEFTDILPSTAVALKDILTERGFHTNEGKIESLIATMIISANKSAKEIVDDESKKAFYMDRFPLQADVKWVVHTVYDYNKLLTLHFKDSDPSLLYFLAKVLEDNHLNFSNTISPRVSLDIAKVFLRKGYSFIDSFPIDLSNIEAMRIQAAKEHSTKKIATVLEDLLKEINSIEDSKDHKILCLEALKKIDSMKIKDEMVSVIIEAKKSIEMQLAYRSKGDIISSNLTDLIQTLND